MHTNRPAQILASVTFALGFLSSASAHPQDQDALKEKKANFLKEEFLTKANWILDYDVAREESKKTGKPIFGYFTRSYAP